MSSSFYAYPASERIPTYSEILATAARYVDAFLADFGIPRQVELTVELYPNNTSPTIDQIAAGNLLPVPILVPADQPAWWPHDHHAIFGIKGVGGGCMAYAYNEHTASPGSQQVVESHLESLQGRFGDSAISRMVVQNLRIGRKWEFCRYGGPPAIIHLIYGMLAAATAQLTDGFVDHFNGWDNSRFPALPQDFVRWYFRPEMAEEPDNREWAEQCIRQMKEEL